MSASNTQLLADQLAMFGSESMSESAIFDLLTAVDDLFHNATSESPLTDAEYDDLRSDALARFPRHQYFTQIGASVRGSKVPLPHKMGSLTQSYEGDTAKWVDKHGTAKAEHVVTEKLDGVSVLVQYDSTGRLSKAFSRGDGTQGADVTRHVVKMRSVPLQVKTGPYDVRAESIISKANFQKVRELVKKRDGEQYKNARNMVAGVMNASSNDDVVYDYVDLVAYEVLVPNDLGKLDQLNSLKNDNGFITPKFVTVLGNQLTDDHLTTVLNKMRDESAYEIDGIVIEADQAKIRADMNPTKDTLNPEYARKFKIASADNVADATVVNVEWNVSKDGYFKPRVQIEPTELMGVTVRNATGFNAKYISDNLIGPGAVVRITRSGDVTPYIMEVVSPAPEAQMPSERNVHWTDTGVDLVLDQTDGHATVQMEQLNDFFDSIGAPHLREGNLQKLFDAGYDTPEDIITLPVFEMAAALGSEVMAKKVAAGLKEQLTNVHLYTLMGSHKAFGRGVGVRKMKKLYEALKGDVSQCTNVQLVTNIEGFNSKTAEKIAAGYAEFCEFYQKIQHKVSLVPYEAPTDGPMSGQTVVFTGFRDSSLESTVASLGGQMGSSVSRNTTFVVAADPYENSGKLDKARKLGIEIKSREEFNYFIEGL